MALRLKDIGTRLLSMKEVPEMNKQMCDVLEKTLTSFNAPAIAAGIIRLKKPEEGEDCNIEFAHAAVGKRKMGSDVDVTVQDNFHLGSCGKAFTSLLLQDVINDDDSTLSWDTTLGNVIEDIKPCWHHITLADLMCHKAGISDDIILNGVRSGYPGRAFDLCSLAMKGILKGNHELVKQVWGPYLSEEKDLANLNIGERVLLTRHARLIGFLKNSETTEKFKGKFRYSNVGVSLAGLLAELETNKTYELLVKESLADNLGMNTLGFGSPQSISDIDNVTQPWGHINDSLFSVNNVPVHPSEDLVPEIIQGSGNMHCTMEDWMKSLAAHLFLARKVAPNNPYKSLVEVTSGAGYGGGWIISDPAAVPKSFFSKQEPPPPKLSEGLLLSKEPEHSMVLSHDGSNTRWFARCAIHVGRGVGVGFVTNTSHVRVLFLGNQLMKELLTIGYGHDS
mmetsp:Transcript_5595/g.9257  ORF Transcript_5595/g.9257 Transcript_5595/m.9257 type:complete len:450 (+) Transcript_5595:26-1375(+)